jgi:hypothetical protein
LKIIFFLSVQFAFICSTVILAGYFALLLIGGSSLQVRVTVVAVTQETIGIKIFYLSFLNI